MLTECAHTVNGSREMDAELELEPCSIESTLQSGPVNKICIHVEAAI